MIDKIRKLIIPPTSPFISDIDKLPVVCAISYIVVRILFFEESNVLKSSSQIYQ